MKQDEAINEVAAEMGIVLPENNFSLNRQLLADKINDLLKTGLQKLISILYRLDINETKLRKLLHDNPETDAGVLIADLIIERQVQKIESRRQFNQRDNDIDENEKW